MVNERQFRRAASALLLCAAGSASAWGQTPLAKFGVTSALGGDSVTYAFSFAFNRVPGEDASAGGYLKAWKLSPTWGAGLKPSTEVNIGSGVESSSNNVIAELALDFTRFVPREGSAVQRMLFLAPSANYAADKDFTTRLLYGELSAQYFAYRSIGPDSWRGHVLGGLAFDAGTRQLTGARHHTFTRWVPSLGGQIRSGNWTVSLDAKAFAIHGDTSVVKNGTYGLAKLSVNRKVKDRLGLSASYANGFDEPLYERQNAIQLGIAIYP